MHLITPCISGHENMDLQRRLHELSDLDLKCSEINHAIRKYKEKYDSLVSNLPAYKDETDIAYLKSKIRELELKNSKTESKLSASQEQNRALEEANKKLTRTTSKYKSDIRRIALILTQQEEIITKYEVGYNYFIIVIYLTPCLVGWLGCFFGWRDNSC